MLWAVTLLLVSCSIYDDYSHRRQYDIDIVLTDADGNEVSDTHSSVSEIYAFVNGVYSGKYTLGADGKAHIVLSDQDQVTFVAVCGSLPEEYMQREPSVGVLITAPWLSLNSQADGSGISPSDLFYGSMTVNGSSSTQKEQHYLMPLSDIRGKMRVMVRGLGSRFGQGDYYAVLDGLSGGLSYDGSPTGDLKSYRLTGSLDASGNWISESIDVLPTPAGTICLLLYKADGTLVMSGDLDENNQPFSISTGEDAVLVVSISKSSDFSIKVIPFEDIDNSGFFQ